MTVCIIQFIMKKYGFVLSVLFVVSSCSTTEQVVLQTMEPSPVALPSAIKRIGIIDRSVPPEDFEIASRVDQYLAAENQWLSENGTDAAITGLFDELLKDRRFETVKLLDSVTAEMKNFGSVANSISWESVESLCKEFNVDALFSLAYYDTDTKVSVRKASVVQADLMRRRVEVKGQEITLETLIENGWRIYDPVNRQVIDDIVFNDQITSTGKGVDQIQAYKSIDDRREAIISKSRTTGSNYGLRLLPFENSVSRSYYTKGTANFAKANELIISGNWQGARDLWAKEVENTDAKIRSRSCHNIAVVNERNDDLEMALEWTNKSLENYTNKVTLAYLATLKERIVQKNLLESQLTQLEFSK